MEFQRIQLNKGEYEGVFPKRVISELSTGNPYIYGALEKGRIVAAAAFSIMQKMPGSALLHCVVTDKNRRREGVGSALLGDCLDRLKEAGVSTVFYREINEDASALLVSCDFASANGFLPVAGTELFLLYDTMKIMELPGVSVALKSQEIRKISDSASETYIRHGAGKYPMIDDIDPGLDPGAYFKTLTGAMCGILQDPDADYVTVRVIGDDRYAKTVEMLGEPEKEFSAIEMYTRI